MNPAQVERTLKNDIICYLDRALPITNAMSDVEKGEFEAFQQSEMDFVQPPFLERSKEYQNAQDSLQILVGKQKLEQPVADAFARYLLDDERADAANVYPYQHQANALDALSAGKHMVICTGTGSGKTESFLLPILNHIYKSKQEPNHKNKVRMLILYPMNALVNDQIRRLRKILKYLPDITFGCYTGDTGKDILDCFLENIADLPDACPAALNPDQTRTDENALPNEFRTRMQWESNEGPADILVTNYSMLERLLLLPNTKIFDECWDFIVIDEAHSYSGSLGTEISWLMRRLERRMRPQGKDYAPIQYVAASATLSDDPNSGVRERVAREFTANLFPIENSDSVHVEFGTDAEPDLKDASPLPGTVFEFFCNNETLYQRTIEYEAKRNALKELERQIPSIREIFNHENTARAITVFELGSRLENCRTAVERDETITFLKSFYNSCHGRNARKLSSSLNILYRKATKLEDEWYADETPLSWEGFAYLYEITLRFAQEHPEWNLRIPELPVKLTEEAAQILRELDQQYDEDKNTNEQKRRALETDWREALPDKSENLPYPTRLYRALVSHPDITNILDRLAGKPVTFPELANNLQWEAKQLQDTLDLAALAIPLHRRMPLFDIRYHQVIRDITDIGIYFAEGNIKAPRFVRSEQEYSETGEKIFTLGLCRDCGQPYLLGYAEENIDANVLDSSHCVYRAKTRKFRFLQAFAWHNESLRNDMPEEDNFPKDRQATVWLNLRTGQVVCNGMQPDGESWFQVYWLLNSAQQQNQDQSSEFIGECARCGGKQSNRGNRYGIVTPYEASGQQYKIAVLNSFARLADPERDQDRRKNLPAGGRKVLAFSDSRAKASSLAYLFEITEERQLMVSLIQKMLHPSQEEIDAAQARYDEPVQEIKQLRTRIREIEDQLDQIPPRQNGLRQQLSQKLDQLKEQMKKPKQVKRELDSVLEGVLYCNNAADCVKNKSEELIYPQLLDLDNNGTPYPPERIAQVLVLKALRDRARKGLMRQRMVNIRSKSLREMILDENDPAIGNQNLPEDAFREMCQDFFEYVVSCKKIVIQGNDEVLQNFFDDGYTKKGINQNSKILKKIVQNKLTALSIPSNPDQRDELCRQIFSKFENDGNGEIQNCILPYNNGGQYCMDFDFICNDIYLMAGEENPENAEAMLFAIEEHTAQIHGNLGAVYQQKFSEGKVNILSCSTTFEMGIDVGGLNSVFLGNLPPEPANYRQRAGRAGRRPGAAAYILSLAGSSAHDRYFYHNLSQLFWGPVKPPAIYRDRPSYGARHMRAEALHSFLCYLERENGIRDWNVISRFLTGYVLTGRGNQRRVQRNESYCRRYLGGWKDVQSAEEQTYLLGIKDYDEFSSHLAPGYNAVDDLIFQLICRPGDLLPQIDVLEYQKRGGCRLPEKDDTGSISESTQFKRKSLEDRIQIRLRYAYDDHGMEPPEDFQPTPKVEKELSAQAISVLSESCILPKYGFPTEVIELLPNEYERDAYKNVTMTRALQYGLFEYAPQQIVTANKRGYESKEAVFYLNGNHMAGNFAVTALYCQSCLKVFDVQDQHRTCPICEKPLQTKTCVKPDAFRAQKSSRNFKQSPPRGVSIVRWGGRASNQFIVPGFQLSTAESSTRMMQYINAGVKGEGYEKDKHFFIHEAQTNIAIWEFTGNTPVSGHHEQIDRACNAHLSVLYALRRVIARTLNIAIRDIGALLSSSPEGHPQYVFYDTAAGGGCCALALVMRRANDTDTAALIDYIVCETISMLETDLQEKHHWDENEAEKMPVPLPELNVIQEEERERFRQTCACYDCLKDFDNQFEHEFLDAPDALAILKCFAQVNPVQADAQVVTLPADIDGRHFMPFDQSRGEPDIGSMILKRDRTAEPYYGNIALEEIWGIEGE